MNRRDAMRTLVATGAALSATTLAASELDAQPGKRPPILAMLAYPGMFPLDLVGPEAVFSGMGTHRVALVWKNRDPVPSSSGFGIIPTMSFAEAEAEGKIDILFVPGGTIGTMACMEDPDVLGFLRRHAADASLITSVCTGSLILGAAGLLQGYRATSHWVVRDKLSDFGAVPVEARVVEDRNRITGAGVTAGVDMALTLAARLVGPQTAKGLQLNIEYDPDPPFDAGTPTGAGPEVTAALTGLYAPFLAQLGPAVERAAARVRAS
jgi:cyclohexyl-isocyanide hydratase